MPGIRLAWPMVSYLVVRLGRIVLTTWIWASMLTEAGGRLRQGGRGVVAGIVLAALGLWGIGQEASSAWLHLRQPQVADGVGTAERLDELAASLEGVDASWLLTDPRILILDDSTSAIDSATEDRIQRAIEQAAANRTMFLITHRLSQIRRADLIIVMRKGQVAAVGTHEQLMHESQAYRNIFARYES